MTKPPSRKDNNKIQLFVDDNRYDVLKTNLANDNIEQKELLVTSIDAYINGNAKKLTKSGKVIRMYCEIEELNF